MMSQTNNAYLRNSVLTASPEQLQLMLYDGAIRFAQQGRDALTEKNFEQAYEKLRRAQHIVLEMRRGLRHEVNPELCERMTSLYNFIYNKLIDASTHRDTQAIDDAIKILRLERETWQIIVTKVNEVRGAGSQSQPAMAEAGASLCLEG